MSTETRSRHRRARGGLSVALGVIAVFGALASVLSVWSYRTVFDTNTVARSVDRALSEPDVVDAISSHLTDQIFEAIPATRFVEGRLPLSLSTAADLLATAARPVVEDNITRLLSEEATRKVIVAAAERSHRGVMRVLDGGRLGDGVTVDGGTVSINLLPVIGRALHRVQDAGFLTQVAVPSLGPADDPTSQIAQLEDALGRPLPVTFGQVVVYDSEHVGSAAAIVARAQQALVLFRRATVAILAVTIVCVVAALAFAARRRRAVLFLSIGLVAAMALGRAIILEVVSAAPALAVRPGSSAAIRAMVTTMAEGLLAAVTVTLALALGLMVFTVATGPGGCARSLRRGLQENREIVSLGAFLAVAAVLSISAFSFGPLVLVAGSAASIAALAWLPQERHEISAPASHEVPDVHA